jgi:hypothetical protein
LILFKIVCTACHHIALLTQGALLRLGLSHAAKVLDLKALSGAAGAERGAEPLSSVKWGHRSV